MDDRRHNDEVMMVAIARLEEKMISLYALGQQTLEQAQKTNGRVTKHDDDLQGIKIELAENRGKAKVSGALWGVVSAVVATTIGKIIFK